MPQVESLTGSKNELRVTWLKNDTTATAYRIAGEMPGQIGRGGSMYHFVAARASSQQSG